MNRPIFFSVCGTNVAVAHRAQQEFSSDRIHLYSDNGKQGADFPMEIERELAECQCFVIFWSSDYIAEDHPWTRRELALASKRKYEGALRHDLIIRLDETPLESLVLNPLTGRKEDLLKPFRDTTRANDFPFDSAVLIQQLSEKLGILDRRALPIFPRYGLEQQLLQAMEISGQWASKSPVVFVSGLEGSGRSTLINSVMGSAFRHLTRHTMSMDNISTPDELLFLIHRDVVGRSSLDVETLAQSLTVKPDSVSTELVKALGLVAQQNKYLVIKINSLVRDVGSVPFWVGTCLQTIQPLRSPVLFFTVRQAPRDVVLNMIPHSKSVHVPLLEDTEAKELTRMLVSAIDPDWRRWSDANFETVERAVGSSPALIEAIVTAATFEKTLDFLDKLIPRHAERFAESISTYLAYVMEEMIKGKATNFVILSLVDALGVVTFNALQEMTKHIDTAIGDNVYTMRRQGLLEQMEDGIYRIPPLLRNRLNAYLIGKETVAATTEALRRFANATVTVGSEDQGQIFLYNKVRAKLSANVPITTHENLFVSAAMLFREADSSYKARRYPVAFDLYKRAFEKVKQLRDGSAEIEVARYLGLCSARLEKKKELTLATTYLRQVTAKGMQDKAKGIAEYIEGFHARLDEDYPSAERHFRNGIKLMPKTGMNIKGRSILLSELARVLVKIEPPQFADAVFNALSAVDIDSTAQNINWLIHVLLQQTYRDGSLTQIQVEENFTKIDAQLEELRVQCNRFTDMDYYEIRQAESEYYAERERVRTTSVKNKPDYHLAIEWQQKAYDKANFPDHLPQIWRLKFKSFSAGHDRRIALTNLLTDLDRFITGAQQTRHTASAEYWKVVVLFELEGKPRAQAHFDRCQRCLSKAAASKLRSMLQGNVIDNDLF